ncbi:MAG: isoaspartyl peptidase/L-asparaginase [Melioribacteraceae bacterium]|nr:isoaspartyl peptidase/L-asparaginase [Melioribacteraceae bacterium]
MLISCDSKSESSDSAIGNEKIKFGLVIHGGAGYIHRDRYNPEEEKIYKDKLEEALQVGYAILHKGGAALDAVERTIHVLENSPLFNAGKGAVMTSAETIELDAAIMDGSNINAGTCAGITTVKNPISLARAIMEKSKHVMMIGKGAEAFAEEIGLEIVDNDYFKTEKRLEEIRRIKAEERKDKGLSYVNEIYKNQKLGTVGCVALDKSGNLAAGTSTGGMSNKKWGRVGDVPIIGAGTYANNKTCALSATGHGEFFIRNVVTHDISALMEYKNMTISKAADEVIMNKLLPQNGIGGVIGIDGFGNITMTFNSEGMFRGYITDEGNPFVAMYKE